ncbi:hypothetical protein MNBD_GAMMA26-2039 [hydrothermal vent metagenome]|uniref:PIN domain-containing protein n=1 Tax=hydrothermal vent metagenome TaxID=652676 RepID=A0A3B1BJM0_9ZZZZ
MKNILIDTNGYIAFKKGVPEAVEIIKLADNIGFSVVVLGELLAGFVCGGRETTNRTELGDFLSSPRVCVYSPDDGTAEFYARIFKQLKQDGRPIPTNDLWIAATALQRGYGVFTYDRHFTAIKNLITISSSGQLYP